MLTIADGARAVAIGGSWRRRHWRDRHDAQYSTRKRLSPSFECPSYGATLNLPSDASYRFERGVDPAMILRGLGAAAQLVAKLRAAGRPPRSASWEDCRLRPQNVRLRYRRCDQLLGVSVPREASDAHLEAWAWCRVEKSAEAVIGKFPVPCRLETRGRPIEEVVRQYGISNIPVRTVAHLRRAAQRIALQTKRLCFVKNWSPAVCSKFGRPSFCPETFTETSVKTCLAFGILRRSSCASTLEALYGLQRVLVLAPEGREPRSLVRKWALVFPSPVRRGEQKHFGHLVMWRRDPEKTWRSKTNATGLLRPEGCNRKLGIEGPHISESRA